MHHVVVKFSKCSSPQATKGHLPPPPNQNPRTFVCTYDARTPDSAVSAELEWLTDAHVSVESEQHRQPRVARAKPVRGGTYK